MKGKWIWINKEDCSDEYGDFFETLNYKSGKVTLKISCDTKYAIFIGGKLAVFGQYADYPWYKVYDEADITDFLVVGENRIKITVWYFGDDFLTYYKNKPCLFYEIYSDGELVACSSENTLCSDASGYVSHRNKKITFQMSYSFRYDTGANENEKRRAVMAEYKPDKLFPRPIDMLTMSEVTYAKQVGDNVYDLGRETVGFLNITFKAKKGTVLTVSYGEHIADNGHVRRLIKDTPLITDKEFVIGYRDFSVELVASGETTTYLNPFLRLGCRYLEVTSEGDFTIENIGINEVLYPVKEIPFDAGSELRNKIYQTSVRTLRINMHEHYEDTPWREQSLYNMDSRNQMLSGYYAFKEYKFVRSNLKLMAEDRRKDNLLSSCFPSSINLVLPSFNLHFFTQMREYADYSGDISLFCEYYDRCNSLMKAFTDRIKNGLVPNFYGGPWYFNFYEWSDENSGNLSGTDKEEYHVILNCLLSIALENLKVLCEKAGKEFKFSGIREKLNERINEVYYDDKTGYYHRSELGNAFAVLCGATDKDKAVKICDKITEGNSGLIPVTLSMKAFVYDALIKTDKEKYRDYILKDIDENYSYMLSKGATSFWETIKGESDFGGAGSLSHGWSAIPVYYYNVLLTKE